MFRELEAYIVKNGNDCCRSEVKNSGRLGALGMIIFYTQKIRNLHFLSSKLSDLTQYI